MDIATIVIILVKERNLRLFIPRALFFRLRGHLSISRLFLMPKGQKPKEYANLGGQRQLEKLLEKFSGKNHQNRPILFRENVSCKLMLITYL